MPSTVFLQRINARPGDLREEGCIEIPTVRALASTSKDQEPGMT